MIGYGIVVYITYLITYCISSCDRITRKCKLKVHSLSAHLYTKYNDRGYNAVKNFNGCLDLATKDVLFFPVNYNSHWSMFVVKDPKWLAIAYKESGTDKKNQKQRPSFLFFDSCKDKNYHCFRTVGTKIIAFLLKNMSNTAYISKLTFQDEKIKGILQQYGYVPPGM